MIMLRRTIVLFAAIGSTAAAQNAPAKWPDTLRTEIDRAFIGGEMPKIQAARALAERVATAYPDDALIQHYLGFALYREATLVMGQNGNATPLLERAKTALEKSIKARPLAESHILMSSIFGQLIGNDGSRAMELGMAAGASAGAAMAMGRNNPRVFLISGVNAMYTPPEYGGGLKLAEEQLKKAIDLFAKDAPKPGEPSWGRAEAHVWLGQVYQAMKDKTRAAAEYNAALAIEPSFSWAKLLLAGLK